jgi:hypothetical protein
MSGTLKHLKIVNMTKKKLIEKIKGSLQATLNIGQDTFNDCPIHKEISKDEQILIETINHISVSCTHYVHGIEINCFDIQFEEISKENLLLILENVEQANDFFNE